tara:strand:- start:14925 stop:15143 length:219 start_codon:yes stop_codon:yes gene_type:complete
MGFDLGGKPGGEGKEDTESNDGELHGALEDMLQRAMSAIGGVQWEQQGLTGGKSDGLYDMPKTASHLLNLTS